MNNVITFVTSYRKFIMEFNTIQEQTLQSWQAHDIKILAPDNEVGLAGPCFGVNLLKGIKTARDLGFKTSAPVMSSLLKEAMNFIDTPIVGIINSDVVIGPTFPEELGRILTRHGFNIFLTDARYDFILTSKFHIRRMLADMPELIMGRAGCDSWIVEWAKKNIDKILDSTGLTLTHLEHGPRYKWLQEGRHPPSEEYNRRLIDGKR